MKGFELYLDLDKKLAEPTLRNKVELGNVSRVIANAPGPNPHLVASEYQSYALRVLKKVVAPESFSAVIPTASRTAVSLSGMI